MGKETIGERTPTLSCSLGDKRSDVSPVCIYTISHPVDIVKGFSKLFEKFLKGRSPGKDNRQISPSHPLQI